MLRVLFVCTGNTCRSPMAEAVFNDLASQGNLPIRSESAGLAATDGEPMSSAAVQALSEIGIMCNSHKSRPFQSAILTNYDIFVGMTDTHSRILRELGISPEKILSMDEEVPDPYGCSLDVYRTSLAQIQKSISLLLIKIKEKYGY